MFQQKKVLLLIDGSFLSFVVNYRAFRTWTNQYQSMDTCIIRPPDETDQDNLPDLVNESKWFKKCLHNATVDKLNDQMMNYTKTELNDLMRRLQQTIDLL